MGNIFTKNQNRIFIFTFSKGRDFILKMIQTFFKKDLFISQKSIHENLKALILPKTASKQLKNLFNKFIYVMIEQGIDFSRRNIPNYTGIETIKFGQFIVFDGIQNYIEYFTITKPISYDKVDALFKFYFGILILLISTFLIHHFIKNYINYAKILLFFKL